MYIVRGGIFTNTSFCALESAEEFYGPYGGISQARDHTLVALFDALSPDAKTKMTALKSEIDPDYRDAFIQWNAVTRWKLDICCHRLFIEEVTDVTLFATLLRRMGGKVTPDIKIESRSTDAKIAVALVRDGAVINQFRIEGQKLLRDTD